MRAAYEGDITRVAELVFRDAANNKHVYLVKRKRHSAIFTYAYIYVYYMNDTYNRGLTPHSGGCSDSTNHSC